MITDIFLYIVALILTLIYQLADTLASGWTIWPTQLLDGMTYFANQIMLLNGFFPGVIVQLFLALKSLLDFMVIYLFVKLLFKLFNWIRGASGIEL
jgi:hypothetical protein